MKTLTVTLPDALTPEQEHDLKMELAGLLFTKQLLTSSEAAALVGVGRGDFFREIGNYGFSLLATYSEADFEDDLATLRRYSGHQLPDFTG